MPDEIPDYRRDPTVEGRVLWRRDRRSRHIEVVRVSQDQWEDWNGGPNGYLMRAAGFVGASINVRELAAIVENIVAALSYLPPDLRDQVINGAERCLDGSIPYDDLGSLQKAIVREQWTKQLDEASEGLDLEEVFRAEGRTSWVVVDPDGTTRVEGPGVDLPPLDDVSADEVVWLGTDPFPAERTFTRRVLDVAKDRTSVGNVVAAAAGSERRWAMVVAVDGRHVTFLLLG